MNRVKKNKLFWVPGLIGVVSILLIAFLCLNSYAQKKELYQKKVEVAREAMERVTKVRSESSIQQAEHLIKFLKFKEEAELFTELDRIKVQLNDITSISKEFNTLQNNITKKNFQKIKENIQNLSGSYFSVEKREYTDRLNQYKNIIQEKERYKGKKIIALTFDDGPNPETTPYLLETLRTEKVPVTFFALGKNAQAYPNIIKEEQKEGNEVASHTWDHQDLVTLSPKEQRTEILNANQLINKITGKDVKIFRPPYGSYSQSILDQINIEAVNWTVDTNDWRYNTSEPVIQNSISGAYDGAIILMHDIHPWSVNAVPSIIDELKKENYCFVTVDQLLEIRESGVQLHKVYFGE